MNGKGQGIALDFLFAILVFLLVLNATMALIDSSNVSVAEKGLLTQLTSKTEQTMDMLVRTDGSPSNWEEGSLDDAVLIGLARRDRVLDQEKLKKFVEWASTYRNDDYNKLKTRLLIGYDYYFAVKDSTGSVVTVDGTTAETDPLPAELIDKMTAISVKRIVNYNGVEAIAQFTTYYPER